MADKGSGVDANGRPIRLAAAVCIVIAACLMASMLRVAYDRHLVGTVAPQEWGRYLYGLGAAITHKKFGIAGFAIDERIESALLDGGLTDTPRLLDALGYKFPANLADGKLLDADIRHALSLDIPPPPRKPDAHGRYGPLKGSNGDDTGIGTYMWLAFKIFGPHLAGATYLYFLMLAVAVLFFTIAHRRSPASMVALSAMVLAVYLTEMSDFVNVVISFPLRYRAVPGLDIKDPRFMSTLAVVPLLHMFVAWFRPDYCMRRGDYAALAGQSAILAFVLHLRSPAEWAVLAIVACWLVLVAGLVVRGQKIGSRLLDFGRSDSLPAMSTIFSILIAGHLTVSAAAHPVFKATGDITQHTFWHGVLYGLQVSPDWGAKYGAAFDYADGDAMPVAAAKKEIMKLPADKRGKYLTPFGAPTREGLEKYARIAFFNLAWHDPLFVAYTFLIVKPYLMVTHAFDFYRGIAWNMSALDAVAAATAMVVLIWIASRDSYATAILMPLAGAGLICLMLAWLPNWLVAVNQLVMVDNFVWTLFSLCVVVIALGSRLVRALWPRPASVPPAAAHREADAAPSQTRSSLFEKTR